MTGELFINGADAYTYGVEMGDKFLDVLGENLPLKDFITNSSRMEDGVRYTGKPKVNERSFILEFRVSANSNTMQANKKTLLDILYASDVVIYVPANSGEYYHLKYTGLNASYAQNTLRTFCKVAAKFIEPNPTLRTEQI